MTNAALRVNAHNLEKIGSFAEKFSKEKQKVDYFKIFSHFVQSSYGSKKLFKAFYLGCQWPVNFEGFLKLTPTRVKKIIDVKKQFKKVSQSLDVTKIPATIKKVKKISIIQRKDFKSVPKKVFKIAIKVVQIILDVLTFIGLGQIFCFYSLGNANGVLKLSKRCFKVIASSFLFFRDRTKYIKHSKSQKVFESEKSKDLRMKTIFHEIKNLDFLKIIKNITIIALNCFITFELFFEVALISATIKILLSTISLSLAIFTHFYKASLTYPEI
ncbi:MAG: hypothetical protein KR126chlam5_00637, partial [Candidatus Anoxychlamydiales bacterium]|nr:hypothetical protein [Candidatus Anoxychlamydiales bacterium]